MKSIKFMPMMLGVLLLVIGLIFMYFPPKKMNAVYGYRTPRSYGSQECWDFAQKYSAKVMVISSVCLLIICGAVCYIEYRFCVHDLSAVIVNGILITILSFIEIAMVLHLTERALAKL